MVLKIIACAALGYFIGSVVWAILISKAVFGEDVRTKGSGNSGATNAARVYGFGFGMLTFLGDLLKGVLACLVGRLILGDAGLAAAGAGCMLGHCFPLYFGFKGGKCVSVGAALALSIDFRIFLTAIAIFLIIALITKFVSLGSIAGSATVGVMSAFLPEEAILKAVGVCAAVMVIALHHSNIKRLIEGKEKKFKFGKR